MTQDTALKILKTGANVFLTGEPGSGKTHTVNQYASWLRAHGIEPAITASTGIAATHIGGLTVHSWSGIGIKSRLSAYDLDRIASNERIVKRIQRTKILIIDEVSMLSPDTLFSIDEVCREILQSSRAFGGLQIVFVGDFFQLPPIVKTEAGSSRLPSHFAYESPAWMEAKPIVCYLTEQYRQDDNEFLGVLSAIRRNAFAAQHLRHIQKRKVERHNVPKDAPKLFSHNADVDRINTETLEKLPTAAETFAMSSEGNTTLVETLTKNCLSPELLSLKVGASVMFTKNNLQKGFVNGTLGTVREFSKQSGYPVVETRNFRRIEVEPMDWVVEENGRVRASITQVPLRLAWAITVHKSQGMSLDEAAMDLSDVFEYGQGYVALSRVRRLSGLHLLGWNERTFQVHPDVLSEDVHFRAASGQAEHAFSAIAQKETFLMHERFMHACGGSFKKTTPKKTENPEASFATIRDKHPNAYKPWPEESDQELQKLFADKVSVADIAKIFGRKNGAIRSRLMKLGLMDNYFKGRKRY